MPPQDLQMEIPILISHELQVSTDKDTIQITMAVRTNNKKTPLFMAVHLTDVNGANDLIKFLRNAVKDVKIFNTKGQNK